MVAAVAGYVIATTDDDSRVDLSVAPGAFTDADTLDPAVDRAVFSPNGQRLAGIGDAGVGVVRAGELDLVTEPGSKAVEVAWMPDSASLLVVEGPAVVTRLTVLTLDGEVKGVAHLDTPFSVGAGHGMTVDSRGARAVVTTETRDVIGGRRRLDLALVDLPTGRVTPLTTTPDVNEMWPVFVDEERVVFSRGEDAAGGTLVERDLRTGRDRDLTPPDGYARAVGVIGTRLMYASRSSDGLVTVWAGGEGGRTRLGRLGRGSIVWTVDRTGSLAVVTGFTTTPQGQRIAQLRAVTLNPPGPG